MPSPRYCVSRSTGRPAARLERDDLAVEGDRGLPLGTVPLNGEGNADILRRLQLGEPVVPAQDVVGVEVAAGDPPDVHEREGPIA